VFAKNCWSWLSIDNRTVVGLGCGGVSLQGRYTKGDAARGYLEASCVPWPIGQESWRYCKEIFLEARCNGGVPCCISRHARVDDANEHKGSDVVTLEMG